MAETKLDIAGFVAALSIGLAALSASGVLAQSAPPEPEEQMDEITVFGQRSLGALRFEVQAARERVYDLFNDLISDKSLEIHCGYERRSGTRIPQRTCRPQYSRDATAQGASDFMAALFSNCPPDMPSQEAIFSECAHAGVSAALPAHSEVQRGDQRLVEEVRRLTRESPEFRRAIYQYQALENQYDSRRRGGQPVVRATIVRIR